MAKSREAAIAADLGRPETPEEIAERKAESARRYRASKTTRNLVIALAASLGLVLFVVLVVVRPEQPPREPVDYATIASQAQSNTSVPLLVPSLPESFTANRAEYSTGADGVEAWAIGFVTPKVQFIEVVQGIDANPTWVATRLGPISPTATATFDGVTWQVYDNRDADNPGNKAFALVTEADGTTIVVNGTASDAEFEEFAKALAPDILSVTASPAPTPTTE